jgi:hypothetical protein
MSLLISAARAPRRHLLVATTGLVALSLLAACGDDSSASTPATDETTVDLVHSTEDWCQVANQIDEVTEAHPFEHGEFADVQAAYADGQQLIDQLRTGIEHVDADVRTEVEALLQLFDDVAGTVVEAPDRAAAAPLVEAILGTDDRHVGVAYEWMSTTCALD